MSSSRKLSTEEIGKWSPAQVIKFLETKRNELFLNENHIKIIENEEIAGPAFLLLTIEELKSYGLKGGPSATIAELVKKLKSEEQTTGVQEVQKLVESLQEKLESLQDQIHKSGIQQAKQRSHAQEKGKKRVGEQEHAGYDFPTKALKISSATGVRGGEVDISDEVNANITKHSAYKCLVEGNINHLVDLVKAYFRSRSMMSLKSTDEAVLQTVVELVLPLTCRVPELRLIIDGTRKKCDGRFGFVDIFVPGGKPKKDQSIPSIVLELKCIKLTGLRNGKYGHWEKNFKTIKLDELDKKLEKEDEDVVLKRRYMTDNSRITTVGNIMENGIRQLQNYINIIAKGPVKEYVDSGVLDLRVKDIKGSGQLMGYVVMSVGTRRILVRSYGPINTGICWSSSMTKDS